MLCSYVELDCKYIVDFPNGEMAVGKCTEKLKYAVAAVS